MPETTTSRCRSCDAEIVWTITEKGKRMPCDLAASDDGGFFLFRRRNPDKIESISVSSAHVSARRAGERGDKRYASHFKTCPNAAQHSRRGK